VDTGHHEHRVICQIEQGLVATGKASDPDTLVASARAYVHALNKLDVRRAKATGAAA
jgi:2-isopropylmalate synthase